jgi:geranylgeranyl reductase family protein
LALKYAARVSNWDVAVVGGGPAGLSAAITAARAGARTIVLERAEYPRYKTCGGGLIGASLKVAAPWIDIPVRDTIHTAVFTHHGKRELVRHDDGKPLIEMVTREEFDDALQKAAADAGVVVRQGALARRIDQESDQVTIRLADGDSIVASTVVGADGSGGITTRHVGVVFDQVDLGLEVEIPISDQLQEHWRGRVLLDWGRIPGSYGWVFPKSDRLTVGVIAARGHGEPTRAYLREFVERLGLSGIEPLHDSGHLTRCRAVDSPLRKGRVIVAGDAAGLLEPWTREGISFALRSGSFAGAAAARAGQSGDPDQLDGYLADIDRVLAPEMTGGRRLMRAFGRHPRMFHIAVSTAPGWRAFMKLCRSEITFERAAEQFPVRQILAVINRV